MNLKCVLLVAGVRWRLFYLFCWSLLRGCWHYGSLPEDFDAFLRAPGQYTIFLEPFLHLRVIECRKHPGALFDRIFCCRSTYSLFGDVQILNFLISLPQLLKIIPCPRHRLPKYVALSSHTGSKCLVDTARGTTLAEPVKGDGGENWGQDTEG